MTLTCGGPLPRRFATHQLAALVPALMLVIAQISHAASVEGRRAYERYCAACHGADGRGSGPLRNVLRVPPTDLTRLQRDLGRFPRTDLMKVLDQSRAFAAHGSPELPVWGEIFWRVADDESLEHSPESRAMREIVAYVESLQTSQRNKSR